jgi:hypothetical protein
MPSRPVSYPPPFWGPVLWELIHRVGMYAHQTNLVSNAYSDWMRRGVAALIGCANCAGHYRHAYEKHLTITDPFVLTVVIHDDTNIRLKKTMTTSDHTTWKQQYASNDPWLSAQQAMHTYLDLFTFIYPLMTTSRFDQFWQTWLSISPESDRKVYARYIAQHPTPVTDGTKNLLDRRWFQWSRAFHQHFMPSTFTSDEQLIESYTSTLARIEQQRPKMSDAERQQALALQKRIVDALNRRHRGDERAIILKPSKTLTTASMTASIGGSNAPPLESPRVPHSTPVQQSRHISSSLAGTSESTTDIADTTEDQMTSWQMAHVLTIIVIVFGFVLLYFVMTYRHKDIDLARLQPKLEKSMNMYVSRLTL